jgi:DNA invertase Pin-like site-specific DNA recombinase
LADAIKRASPASPSPGKNAAGSGKGVDLYLHQQGIDTTTPAGKALFQMMGVFAEFERAMIVERVNAGIARARAEGKKLGRHGCRKKEQAIWNALAVGSMGILKIARQFGVGSGTVQRIKRMPSGARPGAASA